MRFADSAEQPREGPRSGGAPYTLEPADDARQTASRNPTLVALFGALFGFVNLPLLAGVIYIMVRIHMMWRESRRSR